ncbi:hypothetical protein RB195_017575 [Necator americanus]|uniref:Uncharacterized protein n=1 Tax=Necator americanus TaxID=51031 RepID=A0ABR1C7F1_NECAM
MTKTQHKKVDYLKGAGNHWKQLSISLRRTTLECRSEILCSLGVDRQLIRGVKFREIWNSDEWIDSVQALAGLKRMGKAVFNGDGFKARRKSSCNTSPP